MLYFDYMPRLAPILEFTFTDHALLEMARRKITPEDVKEVLARPEQAEMAREGRAVYQAKHQLGEPARSYLLRIFVDIDRETPQVVIVYRTSKIEKYWR